MATADRSVPTQYHYDSTSQKATASGSAYAGGDGQIVADSGTTAERDALGTNLTTGNLFYNTQTNKFQVWTGTVWQDQT